MLKRFVQWAMCAVNFTGARAAAKARADNLTRLDDWLEEITDDDVDQMHSWSISARLAGLPDSMMASLPEEVAVLVREAKEVHTVMAEGSRQRSEAEQQETYTGNSNEAWTQQPARA